MEIYAYFSPVLRGLKTGKLRITSIALTNNPSFANLPALPETLAAGDLAMTWTPIFVSGAAGAGPQVKPTGGNMDTIKKLAVLLGLDAAAFGDGKMDPLFAKAAEFIETLKSDLAAAKAAAGKLVAGVKDALALKDEPTADVATGLIVNLAQKAKADEAALTDARAKLTQYEAAAKRAADRRAARRRQTHRRPIALGRRPGHRRADGVRQGGPSRGARGPHGPAGQREDRRRRRGYERGSDPCRAGVRTGSEEGCGGERAAGGLKKNLKPET